MWNRAWHSLGMAAGFAAKSVGGAAGRGRSTGRVLREAIQAGFVTALVMSRADQNAARLCGAATAAFRRRAILIRSAAQASFAALAQMLRSRRGPSPSIKAVEEQAERIALVLHERGITPNRLGVDGVPGSGKSSLASALAERLDMEWRPLDYQNLGLRGILGRKRTIYEHYRLFRTQDVDAFDAIVYIDEPLERSRARVRRRGRGLILAALLDYRKLKKVGKLAFDVCEGEAVAIPESHLVLKIRPPEGFRAVENIADRLGEAGLDDSPAGRNLRRSGRSGGMSKEETLFLLACGRRQGGLKAYFLPLAHIIGSLAAGLCSAGRRLITVVCG